MVRRSWWILDWHFEDQFKLWPRTWSDKEMDGKGSDAHIDNVAINLSFFYSSVFLLWWNANFNWQIVGCGMNFAYQMGWRKYLIGPYKLVITWHSNPYHHFSNWSCIRGKNHFTFDVTEVSRNTIWLNWPYYCLLFHV